MDTKISKPVKIIAISAAIIVLVLVNLIVFMAPQYEQYESNQLISLDEIWLGGYSVPPFSINSPDPPYQPPKIVYFSNNRTYLVKDYEKWQEPVYKIYNRDKEVTIPKLNYMWRHVPNISVDGNILGYDLSAYNGAGIDCKHAVYNVTLSVFQVNLSTGKYRDEYIADLPVNNIEVTNLPATETGLYRVTAELIEPKPDEIYRLMFRIYAPGYFTDYNDNRIMMKDICFECNPNSSYFTNDFYIYGEDAPEIPTMTYDNR